MLQILFNLANKTTPILSVIGTIEREPVPFLTYTSLKSWPLPTKSYLGRINQETHTRYSSRLVFMICLEGFCTRRIPIRQAVLFSPNVKLQHSGTYTCKCFWAENSRKERLCYPHGYGQPQLCDTFFVQSCTMRYNEQRCIWNAHQWGVILYVWEKLNPLRRGPQIKPLPRQSSTQPHTPWRWCPSEKRPTTWLFPWPFDNTTEVFSKWQSYFSNRGEITLITIWRFIQQK